MPRNHVVRNEASVWGWVTQRCGDRRHQVYYRGRPGLRPYGLLAMCTQQDAYWTAQALESHCLNLNFTSLLTSCMTLASFSSSRALLPHIENENNFTHFNGSELIHLYWLEQCLFTQEVFKKLQLLRLLASLRLFPISKKKTIPSLQTSCKNSVDEHVDKEG